MINYFTAISRNQFNSFYKFGYTVIPFIQLIEFDGSFNKGSKDKIVQLFKILPPFEYDEDYLIIHLEKQIDIDDQNVQFDIKHIVSIYPLSYKAKVSIESKIDTRIKLEEPIFVDSLKEIEAEIQRASILKAISALFRICDVDEKELTDIYSPFLESVFKGINLRSDGIKINKLNPSVDDYWAYLLAYDRYEYFPNSILGFFYDAGELFSYSKGKTDGVIGTKLYDVLENLKKKNSNITFPAIVDELENNSLTNKYVEETTFGKIRMYIVAPLFLIWKENLRNDEADILRSKLFHKNKVSYIDKYPDEVGTALVLLAAFYEFQRFYDTYYDKINLRFYKSYKPKAPIYNLQELTSIATENDIVELGKSEMTFSDETTIKSGPDITAFPDKRRKSKKVTEVLEPEIPTKKDKDRIKESKGSSKKPITKEQTEGGDIKRIIGEILEANSEIEIKELIDTVNSHKKGQEPETDKKIIKILKEMDNVELKPKKKPEKVYLIKSAQSQPEIPFG